MAVEIRAGSGVYVVTDGDIRSDRSHIDIARAAVAGGASWVQLREKCASDRELLATAIAIREITQGTGTIFVVNNRADIALACGADGLHVGQDDLPVVAARLILGQGAIIGVSVGSVEEAIRAEEEGADYVAVSPVFSTPTKEDAGPGLGLEMVRKIKLAVSVHVCTIGGIGPANIAEVAASGADSVAVISAVVCAPDMAAAAQSLGKAFNKGKWADSLARKDDLD